MNAEYLFLIVPIVATVFASGILVQKVNGHSKRLEAGDKKLSAHSEAVASIRTSIDTLIRDMQEVKSDVKQILRNGKK